MRAKGTYGAIFQKVIKLIQLAQDRVQWGPFWGHIGEAYSNERKPLAARSDRRLLQNTNCLFKK
jgi:hypothetical protein